MAGTTFRIPIFGGSTLPDTSGNVTPEPQSIVLANDLYPGIVFKFADSGTKIMVGGAFKVPPNYAGTPKIGGSFFTTATSGDWVQDIDYTAIADGETADPSAHQESVTQTITVPGTTKLIAVNEIALTAGNFAAGDTVEFQIGRDGAQGADTLAAALYCIVSSVYFSYVD